MPLTPNDILKKYWGHDTFRPLQEEAINSILQGRDTLVLLPTGGGKSICYQIPALMNDGLCLVVSPLISLMKDQVQKLREKGIKAACLVSGTTGTEQEIVFNNCIYGKIKLLYVSPERLRQRVFIEHFRQMKVSMIAVDEAHCISQWGYDFRPAYLEIAQIRIYHENAPIMALTATATPAVIEDIRTQLQFKQKGQVLQTSFERPNLAYMVFHEEDKLGRMLRIARNVKGSGIVYVRNRRRTRELANHFIANGISAAYYHAGLDAKERDMAQLRWMKDEVSVMVATNAFGMGIDKPNVKFVIHLDIPSSLEAYFQEAGRAGRDGNLSYAVLLYDNNDLDNLETNFNTNYPTRQQIANAYRAVCNYYQIPLGAGSDCQFDFDMEAICSTYHFNIVEFYNSLFFLEREGMLAVPERNDAESSLHVPISREEIHFFGVKNPRYADLLNLILRMYGGLFTDFTPISERALARRLYLSEEQVANMLFHMDALKVIDYKAKKKTPQIIFTSPRVDAKDIMLSDSNYKRLKQHAHERLNAMKEYVLATSGCRSQLLLHYFGETTSPECNHCDLCLTKHRHQTSNSATLREKILNVIMERPMRADEILERCGDIDETALNKELQALVDERILSINKYIQFFK